MTTEEKLQENAKKALDYSKLTEHIHQEIAHPSTTEIIKITKRGIQTFPVNKAKVQVDEDIFMSDIGTHKYKEARDEQFPNIEVQANCKESCSTTNLQCNSTEMAVITNQPNLSCTFSIITSQPNVWANCIEEWMQSLNEEPPLEWIGILQETSKFYLSVCSVKIGRAHV